MAKEKFEDRRLTGQLNIACKFENAPTRYWVDDKLDVVKEIIAIVTKYSKAGYTLTLRQLHYQFVGHRAQYVNHDSAYKKLGAILDDCRYAGLIDWDAIEDRGRVPHIDYSVTDIANALDDTASQYKLDRMRGQDCIIEVWTEKDALSGIFKRTTQKYHTRLCINKGYTSSSSIYQAYQRVKESILLGKKFIILYFGDHDPSGIDMIRDVRDRIEHFICCGSLMEEDAFRDIVNEWWREEGYTLFTLKDLGLISEKVFDRLVNSSDPEDDDVMAAEGSKIAYYIIKNEVFSVIPIGLTMEQIDQYELPPNPSKLTDPRAKSYVERFGTTCWEVDALEPQVLTNIVESNIREIINIDRYNDIVALEKKEREEVELLSEEYKNKQ